MSTETLEGALGTRPLYRREYDALVAQGYLEGEGVELLDGRIVYAAEEGPPHASVIRRLSRMLFDASPPTKARSGSATRSPSATCPSPSPT